MDLDVGVVAGRHVCAHGRDGFNLTSSGRLIKKVSAFRSFRDIIVIEQ
jgi:hypothetical protein